MPAPRRGSAPGEGRHAGPATRGVGQAVRGRFAFAREFLKEPKEMAAVAPSSRHLARKMVEGFDFAGASAVVEYGPGLGTFSNAIIQRMHAAGVSGSDVAPGSCRFIAIERNEKMAELFRQRHTPGDVTLYCDDAANVRSICTREGIDQVDYVVSGLGWPSFSDDVRERILSATAEVLRSGGEFRTFGYHVGLMLRGAWHFRRVVRRLFSEVTISEVVWRNMPPAFVYRCIK